jgi:hypothetical protein
MTPLSNQQMIGVLDLVEILETIGDQWWKFWGQEQRAHAKMYASALQAYTISGDAESVAYFVGMLHEENADPLATRLIPALTKILYVED